MIFSICYSQRSSAPSAVNLRHPFFNYRLVSFSLYHINILSHCPHDIEAAKSCSFSSHGSGKCVCLLPIHRKVLTWCDVCYAIVVRSHAVQCYLTQEVKFVMKNGGATSRSMVKRRSKSEKRATQRAAHQRWVTKSRQKYLECKRRYAAKPETLARRREIYAYRNEPQMPKPATSITLDRWAKKGIDCENWDAAFLRVEPARNHICPPSNIEGETSCALQKIQLVEVYS